MEDNRALMSRYFLDEVCNKGNFTLVAKLIAPDCIVHDPLMPDISGPEGVVRLVTTWRTAFPDLHFTIEDQIADDNKVAMRVTIRGTQTGRLLDVAPSGKPVTVSGMTIAHLLDLYFPVTQAAA